MTRVEFANKVAEDNNMTKKAALEMVEMMFNTLFETISSGEEVAIMNFGKFKIKDVPARNGVNPSTREPIVVPAYKKVKFEPAQNLKDAVNK